MFKIEKSYIYLEIKLGLLITNIFQIVVVNIRFVYSENYYLKPLLNVIK